jgi:D-3-phosphoglycerate dehydrogenase
MTSRLLVSDSKVIDIAGSEPATGADVTVERTAASDPDTLREVVPGFDALIVDAGTRVTETVLAAGESLSVVGRSGIGVDNVDVAAAAARDIPVVNVPGYCLDEVSTHAIALLLACVREVPVFNRAVRSGRWDWTEGQPIRRLRGQTVGLVAFGRIARGVARKLDGFGVDILAFDPYVDAAEMRVAGAEKVSFDGLLAQSDAVSVHAPLTDDTEGLLDAAAFEALADHAVLVNTARGAIVDEGALEAALQTGEIAGAGLDVRAPEPPVDSSLSELDAVVCTPHVGWYSEDSREELNQTVTADVIRVLEGREPENPVTPEVAW